MKSLSETYLIELVVSSCRISYALAQILKQQNYNNKIISFWPQYTTKCLSYFLFVILVAYYMIIYVLSHVSTVGELLAVCFWQAPNSNNTKQRLLF